MITDLWIENFKGIGKRQHIPLRPVTLLFGANSAGKSTILHALLYFREVVCNHNINPTKTLAGNQTVNLGGIENFMHVATSPQGSESHDISLGCRITLSSEDWWNTAPFRAPWEYDYFHFDMESHGYCWEDPILADAYSHVVTRPGDTAAEFEEQPSGESVFEMHIVIGRRTTASRFEIRHITIVVDGEPLMSCSSDIGQYNTCWWINVWHNHLTPSPDKGVADRNNIEWTRLRTEKQMKLAQNLTAALKSNRFIRCNADLLNGTELTFVSSVLTCPTRSQSVSYQKTPSDTDRTVGMLNRVTLVTLDSFLRCLNYSDHDVAGQQDDDSDGAFVGLLPDGGDSEGSTSDCLSWVSLVAVTPSARCGLGTAVEKVRLACLLEALAGEFHVDSDVNHIPTFTAPSIKGSEKSCHFIGMSLCGPSLRQFQWFDQHRARIDQRMRMGLMKLDECLSEVCYVGPKRSTVPRNLNSDVMDEYDSWGDGLAAWKWMLQCNEEDVSRSSDWLGKTEPGIGTDFELIREQWYEVNSTLIEALRKGRSVEEVLDAQIDADGADPLHANENRARKYFRILLREVRSGARRHPQDVGEGITQVIPVIAACVRASSRWETGRFVVIEQPELHLHPSLAARIGDLAIVTMLSNDGQRSLMQPWLQQSLAMIETHSEHLILRILRRIRQTTDNELPEHIPPVKPDDVCVLWVDNLGDGTVIKRLRISDDGRWLDRWPDGFFRERHEELFE